MRDINLEYLNLQNEEMVQFLYETRRHPEVSKYLLGSPPRDIESHRAWLKKNVPLRRVMCILECDGRPAGYCHGYDFDHNSNTIEVGFVIHPDYQGKGLSHIMIEKFIEKISEIMPDRRVQLYVQASNEKAVCLYQRHGFEMISCIDGVILMERVSRGT